MFGFLFAIAGAYALYYVWREKKKRREFLASGETVQGRVVGYEERMPHQGTDWRVRLPLQFPQIAFTTRGGQAIKTIASFATVNKVYQINQTVEIFYARQNPQAAEIVGDRTPVRMHFLATLLGAGLVVFGLFFGIVEIVIYFALYFIKK